MHSLSISISFVLMKIRSRITLPSGGVIFNHICEIYFTTSGKLCGLWIECCVSLCSLKKRISETHKYLRIYTIDSQWPPQTQVWKSEKVPLHQGPDGSTRGPGAHGTVCVLLNQEAQALRCKAEQSEPEGWRGLLGIYVSLKCREDMSSSQETEVRPPCTPVRCPSCSWCVALSVNIFSCTQKYADCI